MRKNETFELGADLGESIVQRLEGRGDVLGLLVCFDLLTDFEAFFQE